jgi:hypothetical protein
VYGTSPDLSALNTRTGVSKSWANGTTDAIDPDPPSACVQGIIEEYGGGAAQSH